MLFSGSKRRSIADQIDTFGFDFSVSLNDLHGSCEIGFSGDHLTAFNFSSGKIFDPQNNFVGGYNANQQINIAGQIGQNSYDYSVNGVPIAQDFPCASGKHSWFVVNTQPNNIIADVNVAISGHIPTYTTSGADYYQGSGSEVKAYIFNQTPGANFRIFDVEINSVGGPYSLKSFTTGNISSSGEIVLSSNNPFNVATTLPILLYTNFGEVNFDFFIGTTNTAPTSDNSIFFSVTPNATSINSNTSQLYTLYYSSYPSGAQIDVSLAYKSGFTGNSTRSVLSTNVVQDYIYGDVSGQGYVSEFYQGRITGYDSVAKATVYGNGSGYLNSDLLSASGPVSLDYYIKVSGVGEGTIYQDVLMQGSGSVLASGNIPFKGAYVTTLSYNIPGSGGLAQTAIIPIATGSVFLYPTGTATVHFEPNEYSPSVLIKDECFVGPVTENYDLLGVGYAVGPTLSGIVDSNFQRTANPGNYTFSKSFNNVAHASGFVPLAIFDPVMCLQNSSQVFSGLISGIITSGGYGDCSSMIACLPVSGVPSQILISGVKYPNTGVLQVVPNEGFLSSENSSNANAGGYTRTTVSSQSDPTQAVFNQIVQGCNYLGEWAQQFSDVKFSGYQLIPQPCLPSNNTPSYISANAAINGISSGGASLHYPSGIYHPSGTTVDLSGRVRHLNNLIAFTNQNSGGVSYQVVATHNFRDGDIQTMHGRYNPATYGDYQYLSTQLGNTGIVLENAGNHYPPGTPEEYHHVNFDIPLRFPGMSFDGFAVKVSDFEQSIRRALWSDLDTIEDSEIGVFEQYPNVYLAANNSILYDVTGYPLTAEGAPADGLKYFWMEIGNSATDQINLRFSRTARGVDRILQDFEIYAIKYDVEKTGTLFVPFVETTPDSGVFQFSIDGSGSTKRIGFRSSTAPSSGFPYSDITLSNDQGFLAYNSGYSQQSIALNGFFNSTALVIGNQIVPKKQTDAAFVIDLPTGNYTATVRALGGLPSTGYILGGAATYEPEFGMYLVYPESTPFQATLVPASDVLFSGGSYYYIEGTTINPGDNPSGQMRLEVFDFSPNNNLYLRDMAVLGSSYNNSSVDCSVQYNVNSPCQTPLLGWVGGQESIGEMDYAVVRYQWNGTDGGNDIDTATSVSLPGVSGLRIGYGRNNPANCTYTLSGGGSAPMVSVTGADGEALISWGGNNTNPYGDEAVLINFKAIRANYPAATDIPISLIASWYGTPVYDGTVTSGHIMPSGHMNIEFQSFLGGELVAYQPIGQSTYDWTIVSGGRSVQTLNARYNITGQRADNSCGILHYLPVQGRGYFDYGPGLIESGSNVFYPPPSPSKIINLTGFTNTGASLQYFENNNLSEVNSDWSQSPDYNSIIQTPYAPLSSGSCAIYSQTPIGTVRKFSAVPNVYTQTKIRLNADPIYSPITYWMSGAPYVGNTLPTSGTFSGSIRTMVGESIWMDYDVSSGINSKTFVGYSLSVLDNMSGTWLPFSLYELSPSGAPNPCVNILARITDDCKPKELEQDVCITGEYITQKDLDDQIKIALQSLGYSSDSNGNSLSLSSDMDSGYFFYTGGIVFNNPQNGDTVSFHSYSGNYTGTFSGRYGIVPLYPEIDKTWTYGTDFNSIDGLVSLINQNLYNQSYNLWIPSPCDNNDNTIHYEYGPLLQATRVSDSFIKIASTRSGPPGLYNIQVSTSSPSAAYTKAFLRPSVVTLQARNGLNDLWTSVDYHNGINWDSALHTKSSGYLRDFGVNPPNTGDNNNNTQPQVSGSGSNTLVDLLFETGVTAKDKCGNVNSVDIKFFKSPFSGSCTPPDDDDNDKDKNNDGDPNGDSGDPTNPFLSVNILKTGWKISYPSSYNYYRVLLSGFSAAIPSVNGVPASEFYATNIDFYGTPSGATYFSGQTTLEGASYVVNVNGLASGELIGSVTTDITADMSGQYKWDNYQIVGIPIRNQVKFNTGLPGTLVGTEITGFFNRTSVGAGIISTEVQGYYYDDPVNDLVSFSKTLSEYISGCGQISGGPFNVIDSAAWAAKTQNLTQYVELQTATTLSGIAPHVQYPYPVPGITGYGYLQGTLNATVDPTGNGSYTFDQIVSGVPDVAYQNTIDHYDNAYGVLILGGFSEGDSFSVNNVPVIYSTVAGRTAPTYFSTAQGFVDIVNGSSDSFSVSATLNTGAQAIVFQALISGEQGNGIPFSTTSSASYFQGNTTFGGRDYHLTMDPTGPFSGEVYGIVNAVQSFYVPVSGVVSGYLTLANQPVLFSSLWDLQTGTRVNMVSYSDMNWFDSTLFSPPSGSTYRVLSSQGSFNTSVSYFGNASAVTPDVATLRISGVNFPAYLEFNITGSK